MGVSSPPSWGEGGLLTLVDHGKSHRDEAHGAHGPKRHAPDVPCDPPLVSPAVPLSNRQSDQQCHRARIWWRGAERAGMQGCTLTAMKTPAMVTVDHEKVIHSPLPQHTRREISTCHHRGERTARALQVYASCYSSAIALAVRWVRNGYETYAVRAAPHVVVFPPGTVAAAKPKPPRGKYKKRGCGPTRPPPRAAD